MGLPAAQLRQHFAHKGPAAQPDPHIGTDLADLGALHLLVGQGAKSSAIVFGGGSALGNDPEDVIGGLSASEVGTSFGEGGLGLRGIGRGGGCDGCGEGTTGIGTIGTMGRSGRGAGSGWARGQGGLGNRHAHAPEVIPGSAQVRGSLDGDLIRRVVRQHLNEVRYCFELDGRDGRAVLDFTIAPDGHVVGAMSNSERSGLDSCLVSAVRRWDFPHPTGGGAAAVHYPFLFRWID